MSEATARDLSQAVHTVRMLAADGVEKANSGHPGTPMALADIAVTLWLGHLRYDPTNPAWPDRDRFVLSCGHASMLLYSMLHLSGYDVSLDDLKKFRQLGSKTAGHPEVHLTPGVETTTGPLGQGISNAVGMAIALKMRAAAAADDLVKARVFGIASDGDLMEGVAYEASSLAGHLGLDNLVFFYDDNKITIDGDVSLAFSEDVAGRYRAMGWHVLSIDGHDHKAIDEALEAGIAHRDQPTLIIARTHIGIGTPNKEDTAKAHGEPLGADELRLTKEALGWPLEPTFHVPDEVRSLFSARAEVGRAEREAWEKRHQAFVAKGEAAAAYRARVERMVPASLFDDLVAAAPKKAGATRALAGEVQQAAARLVPGLAGGSADLTGSTKTWIKDDGIVQRGAFSGRNFHFGIREHAMGAVLNGMSLTGGLVPYGATFLVFSDYMRPSIRLAALSEIPSIFVFTHDSIYLGEDGPTHQPVEHYWALRLIPNLHVVRPADGTECAYAWAHAIERTDGPTAILLSRQTVPDLKRPAGWSPSAMKQGAYVVADADAPACVLIATGSEVGTALEAKAVLEASGTKVRVVSMPCVEAFLASDPSVRDAVLPPGVPRVSFEVGVTGPWRGIVGDGGLCIGHDRFGASAPASDLAEHFGFTKDAVAKRISAWLAT